MGDVSAIMVRFSPRLTPSAPSACRAELLPTSVITGVLAWNSATSPGSLAALRPDRRVIPNAHKRGPLAGSGGLREERIVGRIGAGPAALDIVDAERSSSRAIRRLSWTREVDALRLRPVAQRGVVEVDAVSRAGRHASRTPGNAAPFCTFGQGGVNLSPLPAQSHAEWPPHAERNWAGPCYLAPRERGEG